MGVSKKHSLKADEATNMSCIAISYIFQKILNKIVLILFGKGFAKCTDVTAVLGEDSSWGVSTCTCIDSLWYSGFSLIQKRCMFASLRYECICMVVCPVCLCVAL
ncbi:hypothetical protein ILYODFUR_006682 [Ilyodon furcidens]|uniref:Uncharacterized protein n=1 Tax=Ilyodon furcidens TaxID=33524 RepID=A0ABV0UPY2_9TELE